MLMKFTCIACCNDIFLWRKHLFNKTNGKMYDTKCNGQTDTCTNNTLSKLKRKVKHMWKSKNEAKMAMEFTAVVIYQTYRKHWPTIDTLPCVILLYNSV